MVEWLAKLFGRRSPTQQQGLQDLYQKPTAELTDADIRRLFEAPDAAHYRFAGTAHLLPILEASRRLREAISKEERSIKWLTVVLALLTLALVGLGIVEYRQHRLEVLQRERMLDTSDGPG